MCCWYSWNVCSVQLKFWHCAATYCFLANANVHHCVIATTAHDFSGEFYSLWNARGKCLYLPSKDHAYWSEKHRQHNWRVQWWLISSMLEKVKLQSSNYCIYPLRTFIIPHYKHIYCWAILFNLLMIFNRCWSPRAALEANIAWRPFPHSSSHSLPSLPTVYYLSLW